MTDISLKSGQMTLLSQKQKSRLTQEPLLAIFDRDGTLTPIVDNPFQSFIPDYINSLLTKLTSLTNVTVGILSARSCRQLQTDFNNDKLILAGNYGLEIIFAHGHRFVHPEALRAIPSLRQAKLRLEQQLNSLWNTALEDHGLSLCLHRRFTPAVVQKELHDTVVDIQSNFPDLRLRILSTAYEFLPQIPWDKACAWKQIEQTLKPKHSSYFRLYAGDSESDEPAFAWVNAHDGLTIGVNTTATSQAQLSLVNPNQLVELIEEIIALR